MGHTSSSAPKALIIGLDGVPFTLLRDYINNGRMGGFKRILGEGFGLHQMDASIPEVSSTSWASFMTGVNPGEHGIYGFTELCPGSYRIFFPSSLDLKAPAVWDIIGLTCNGKSSTLHKAYRGRFGRPLRSVVLNVPQTYPALSLNGALTAGFVCPDLRKGTYPQGAYDYLSSIGYVPDVDSEKAASDRQGFLDDIFNALGKRREAFEHFMKNWEWDLFVGVVTESDRLNHFFFDAAMDTAHPDNQAFLRFYDEMDNLVERLYSIFMEMTDGEGLFLTLSDHGFTVLKEEFYINSWLKEAGFLRLDPGRNYYEQIGRGTSAFAMDPARVYVNLEGKYPGGCVKEAESERLLGELKEGLGSIRDGSGKPVLRAVHEKGELYSGPVAGSGPDLVCVASDGFDLKATLKRDALFGRTHLKGMHTSHDAHALLPLSLDIGGRLGIEDIAPLILKHLAGTAPGETP